LFYNEVAQTFYLKFQARVFRIFVPHSHQKGKSVTAERLGKNSKFSLRDHTDIQSLTPTGLE